MLPVGKRALNERKQCQSVLCTIGVHRWIEQPVSIGMMRLCVYRCRKCDRCGKTQIAKSKYSSILNRNGFRWVD